MDTEKIQHVAALFPMLADAPRPPRHEPEALAAWALSPLVGVGREREYAARLSLAGFVLSFAPEADRGPLARALAWSSPTDERQVHWALVTLLPEDRDRLRRWLATRRGLDVHAEVERAVGGPAAFKKAMERADSAAREADRPKGPATVAAFTQATG